MSDDAEGTAGETPVRHLFVYGTLRRGGQAPGDVRRRLERGAERRGPARVRGRLYEAGSGRFPALVLDPEAGWVAGELHRLLRPRSLLRTLDRYEGRRPDGTGLYRREVVRVRPVDPGRDGPDAAEPARADVAAWTYVYNRDTSELPPVEGGDWMAQSSSSA